MAAPPSEESLKRKRKADSKDAKKNKKLQRKDNSLSRDQESEPSWTVSEPTGGKFIDCDPVFSLDEKLLIFATEYAVNVYSTSNSVLVQSLQSGSRGAITSYSLSPLDSNVLWAATHDGYILKWDLQMGKELGCWQHHSAIRNVTAVASSDGKHETVFSVDTADKCAVTAHEFGSEDDAATSENYAILKSDAPLCLLKVLDHGNIIGVTTVNSFMIGQKELGPDDSIQNPRYTWREVQCKEPPVSFDIRTQASVEQTKKSKKPKKSTFKTASTVDVIVGGLKGCIYVYEDLLNRLTRVENPSKLVEESSPLAGREMHWHREAVGAVAWSKDANYIISGGKETVLVLWQLETGQKKFLPHLESPIQSIVVSPRGSSYAVRLGDNSVMVLSTSELTPTVYVAGLQSTSFSKFPIPEPRFTTVESTSQHMLGPVLNRIAAAINPLSPNHLLAAVPAYQNSRGSAVGHFRPSYLQDFDLSTSRHEVRQAITRTNAINSNMGPEGNRILEPEVGFLQVSCDGKWLATIDEWTVPEQDMKKLSAPGDSQTEYIESKLRFWSWNSQDKIWMLNTLFEDPHKEEDETNPGFVLDLASSPTETRFATLGTDSIVRIWIPLSKTARGKIVRASAKPSKKTPSASEDVWWAVQHVIPLEKSLSEEPLQSINPSSAKLCYSNDGSIIAAYQFFEHDPSESTVYLIDAKNGVLREIQRDFGPKNDEIHGLAFLERYLICLGQNAATVWDVTTYQIHASIPLQSKKLRPLKLQGVSDTTKQGLIKKKKQYPLPHLAVDLSTSTFAITIPDSTKTKSNSQSLHPLLEYQTRLLLFSPKGGSKPIFTASLPRLTSALLPIGGLRGEENGDGELNISNRGFVVLDVGAEIRNVGPSDFHPQLTNGGSAVNGDALLSANLQLANKPDALNTDDGMMPEHTELSDDEPDGTVEEIFNGLELSTIEGEETRPVVRSEQLAEVFDHPTHAMPPMVQLFHSILSLYAEKPEHATVGPTLNRINGTTEDREADERIASWSQESHSESESELESSSDEESD